MGGAITELKRTHLEASEADPSLLIDGQPPFVDPVMFQNIKESITCKCSHTFKGPPGIDAMQMGEENLRVEEI